MRRLIVVGVLLSVMSCGWGSEPELGDEWPSSPQAPVKLDNVTTELPKPRHVDRKNTSGPGRDLELESNTSPREAQKESPSETMPFSAKPLNDNRHLASEKSSESTEAGPSGEQRSAKRLPAHIQSAALSSVVAEVGDRTITREDLYQAMEPLYGMATLEKLVGRVLLQDELQAKHLTISEAELESAWVEAANTFRHTHGGSLEANLAKQYQLTKAEYLEKVLWLDLAVRKLLDKEMSISDSDLFTYFFQHRARYATQEQIELCHILIDPRMVFAQAGETARIHTPTEREWLQAQKQALDLQARLRSGADFSKLAQLHSHDESTKNNGGSLGLFQRGTMRYAGLEDAAFQLVDGAYSEPIKTVMGYHILLRKRTIQAKEPGFDEVKERVRSDFLENVRTTNTTRYLRLLIARAQKDGRLKVLLDK